MYYQESFTSGEDRIAFILNDKVIDWSPNYDGESTGVNNGIVTGILLFHAKKGDVIKVKSFNESKKRFAGFGNSVITYY